jgi:hypothetical protein
MSVNELFKTDLKVVNLGLKSFYNDLKSQNVQTVHVNWKPRAGGNKKMANLLDRLKSTR